MLDLRSLACTGLVLLLGAADVAAEPMDLRNPEARWIEARFETSPLDRPGQTDSSYTPPIAAWLEPGDRPGEIRVTIHGPVVEEHLLTGEEPRPGSFSDFVWIFDADTGHVRSAAASGTVVRTLSLGFMTWKVDARIRIRMDTHSRAGFERRGGILGQEYHRFCVAEESSQCTLVDPRPYDPTTGYVNAVGDVSADSSLVQVRSFSPMGEAIFSELEDSLDERPPDHLLATPDRAHVSSPPPLR